jgi:uncharacterized protein (DUF697 family)
MEDTAENSSWLSRRMEDAFRSALSRAYEGVRVHPDQFLDHLHHAHGVGAVNYDELFSYPLDELDSIAASTIRGSIKLAAAEGAGLGLGGFTTILPDMGILAAITLRMVQKLSLVYGFEYNTDEEVAELWVAAATAAGVDLGRDLIERTVLRTFVERVIARISERFGLEIAETAVTRAVPLVSAVFGGLLNYYFVRAWGRRAVAHFRRRHLEERDRRGLGALPSSPIAPED